MKIGLYTFFLYFALYYVVPYVFGVLYDFTYLDYLRGDPDLHIGFLFSVCFFILFIFCYKYIPLIKTPTYSVKVSLLRNPFFILIVSLFFLVLSSKFYFDYGFQYRHKGTPISESAGYVQILLMLRFVVNGYLVYLLASVNAGSKLTKGQTVSLLLLIVGAVLSMTTSFDLLTISVMIMLLMYHFFCVNLISAKKIKIQASSLLYGVLLVCIVIGVSVFGMANKIGLDRGIEFVFRDGLWSLLETILSRVSVIFYSISAGLETRLFDFEFQNLSVVGNWLNMEFRLSSLLGLEGEKPTISSTARINSLEIYLNARERNGAAPGVVGSILYWPLFPLGVLITLGYTLFVVRLFDNIFYNSRRLSFIPAIFLVTVFQTVCDSQPDVVNLLSVSTIQLFVLYFVWLNRFDYLKILNSHSDRAVSTKC